MPIFIDGYPEVSNVTDTGLDLTFMLNQTGAVYYRANEKDGDAPTSLELKTDGTAVAVDLNYVGQWGSQGSGDGQFSGQLANVAVDVQGNVYVADYGGARVQKFDSSGSFLTKWNYNGVFGITVDGSGNVYVTNRNAHRVAKYDSNGALITSWGGQGAGDGQFNYPYDVTVDGDGYVYVAESSNHRIQKFDSDGNFISKFGIQGSGDRQFNAPTGIAMDSAGNFYVVERLNNRVQKFDSDWNFLTKWGGSGNGDGKFNSPWGIDVDSNGYVYVVDTNNNRIQKFDSDGNFLGKWGGLGAEDGKFNQPYGIAADSFGNIYVTDRNNHRIQKFTYMEVESLTSLLPGKAYDIYAAAENSSGDLQEEPVKITVTMAGTPDTTPPEVVDGSIDIIGTLYPTEVTLGWDKAADDTCAQGDLEYRLFMSLSNSMDTVENVETNGTALGAYEKDIDGKTVDGLSGSTTYYFNVIVKDAYGNKAAYTMLEVATPESPPEIGGTVSIVGEARFGETLEADMSGVTYTPDTDSDVPTYQWKRNGVEIVGAVSPNYSLTEEDIGAAITVTVTADRINATGSVTSAATTVVDKADGPAAPDTPEIESKTIYTVTLAGNMTLEFRRDEGAWQDSNIFTGLQAGTVYLFTARVKETETHKASAASEVLLVTTDTADYNIIYAVNASVEAVRAAIVNAEDGDVVRVPQGTANWSGGLNITKSISLQGCGDSLTSITNASIGINASDINISGFAFTGGLIGANGDGFRIHHNNFVITSEAIRVNGAYGLIDNNIFNYSTSNAEVIRIFGPNDSWLTPSSFGTADAVYVEDNSFTTTEGLGSSQCVQGNYNARFVFRYNTVVNAKVDAHGIWSNGDSTHYGDWDHPTIHSCRHFEIYENKFLTTSPPQYYWYTQELRGGTGISFNNEFTGVSLGNNEGWPAVALREYLFWNNNGNGVGYYLTPDRYPGHDQLGRGMNQELEPLYLWNNTLNGLWFETKCSEPSDAAKEQYGQPYTADDVIKKNRDYYEYTVTFDGTSGVGVGLLADRPATCTPGVGYWATDENLFYKATDVNTWTQYYSPFQYPHPLKAYSEEPPLDPEALPTEDPTSPVLEDGWYDKGDWSGVYDLGVSNTGIVNMEFDVTPVKEGFDSVIGFAGYGAALTGYPSLPVVVKFATSGVFQARNGGSYTNDATIYYSANSTYHFRMVVDLVTKTYDVYITPPDSPEVVLAQDYAFRTDAPETNDIGQLVLRGTNGTYNQFRINDFYLNGVLLSPPDVNSDDGWYDKSDWNAVYDLGSDNTGVVNVEFDVTPVREGFDSIIGFTGHETVLTGYPSMPVIVKFATNGLFQARNGASYASDVSVYYSADSTYHMRMIVNFSTKTYDVYITPPDSPEVTLAQNYAFRTDSPVVEDLGKLVLRGTDGTQNQFRVNNLEINGVLVSEPALAESVNIGITVEVGSIITLTAFVLPENATNNDLEWESSNESIATVDENGVVTTVSEGNATITVRVVGTEIADTCIVTVIPASPAHLPTSPTPTPTPTPTLGNEPSLDLVFAMENMSLSGSSKITGDAGTNSVKADSVNFEWSTGIEGSLFIGPGAEEARVVKGAQPNPQSHVAGGIANLPSVRDYPLPVFPATPELASKGDFVAGWWPAGPHVMNESGAYDSITVNNQLTVNIGEEDVRIAARNLSVKGSGSITVNRTGSGRLILYVSEKIEVAGSGSINKNGDSGSVVIYYAGNGGVDFGGSTKIAGSVFAKNANVTISGSGGITGHIVTGGSNVNVTGNAEANARVIYAPNADLSISGSGRLKGVAVARSIQLSGAARIICDASIDLDFFKQLVW